ncbi:hypothetical protein NPIL_340451 [Nephila pilipes]|uniref:Uncharacterized protein n=1 Tax=Nephila pilipes TaxID=299642 RepID=A0A8X6TJV5_NEPPI|nr:hypothetical protein NPIL_340451 [Nephila pilipes]
MPITHFSKAVEVNSNGMPYCSELDVRQESGCLGRDSFNREVVKSTRTHGECGGYSRSPNHKILNTLCHMTMSVVIR